MSNNPNYNSIHKLRTGICGKKFKSDLNIAIVSRACDEFFKSRGMPINDYRANHKQWAQNRLKDK